jgi:hypothetical protein
MQTFYFLYTLIFLCIFLSYSFLAPERIHNNKSTGKKHCDSGEKESGSKRAIKLINFEQKTDVIQNYEKKLEFKAHCLCHRNSSICA